MQKLFRYIYYLVFIFLFTQTNVLAFGFSSSGSVGRVIVKSQPVFVIRDGKTHNVNGFGRKLNNSDIVVMGKTGKAQVIMSNSDEIFIAPSAKLTILEFAVGSSPTLYPQVRSFKIGVF